MQKPQNDHPAYLICSDCFAIELLYEPQEYQQEFHETSYRYNNNGTIRTQIIGLFGGFGSAKSRASLEEVFIRALANPKGTGLLTAPTLQQLKKTTLKTLFNEIIPPPLIERYNVSNGEIELINGFIFYVIPSDDETKLRSINAGIIHVEEASGISVNIYNQLLTRMRDPFVKDKLIVVCSNPDSGWIKSIIYDNDKRIDPRHPEHEDYNPDMRCYVWKTALNKYLPEDFIEVNSRNKPLWWRRKFLEGSMEHSEGAVYPNFSKCVIDPLPVDEKTTDEYGIPKDWERVIGMDWGARNPTAVPFGAIDPKNGEIIIYNEYYVPNRLLPDHAKHLKPLIDVIPAGRLRFMVADPSIKNKTDVVNGKSVQSLFQEYGMYFQPGNNHIEAGILRVNSYIERGKLKVYYTCVNTVREHLNYKFPELDMDSDKNLDEKPVKKDEHSCDALRYLMMRLPDDPDELKNDAFSPPKRYSTKTNDEFDYEDDYAKGDDFLSYC